MTMPTTSIMRLVALVVTVAAFTSSGAVPTRLDAIPGDGIVSLVWKKAAGAQTYNIYRSTTAGSTGTTPLVSSWMSLKDTTVALALDTFLLVDYGDRSVTNGTRYYYQVTAVTNGTESAKSVADSATPVTSPAELTKSRFLKIMPLGNSITSGWCSDMGGYRPTLYDSLKKAGYNFLFVGSYTYYSDGMWDQQYGNTTYNDPYHEGYNSKQVQGLLHWVVKRALPAHDPDIALLEIGTNNFAYIPDDDPRSTGAIKAFDSLITEIFKTQPDLYLLVAPIIPLFNDGNPVVDAYNANEKAVCDSLARKGTRIKYVTEMENIKANQLCDGMHPTDVAYDVMAGIFFRAIKSITTTSSVEKPAAESRGSRMVQIESRAGALVASHLSSNSTVAVYSLAGRLLARSTEGSSSGETLTIPLTAGSYIIKTSTRSAASTTARLVVR